MRVGIDATGLLVRTQTGIQRYTTSLVQHLVHELSTQPDIELCLYVHSGKSDADGDRIAELPLGDGRRVRLRRWPFGRGYRIALAQMAAMDRLALLHLPGPNLPRTPTCPMLATIHDLCWARLPEDMISGESDSVSGAVSDAARRAAGFIAVSRTTRDDLLAEHHVSADRVWVAYEGVADTYRPDPAAAEQLRARLGLARYVLYVGTLQRRKNLVRLFEVYARVVDQHGIEQHLVVAGSNGWGHEEIEATVTRLGLQDRVRLLGYVSEAELPALYSGADLFVYPSLYEGFGLPVLEAMACGTPVAVARRSSLPEVAGDAALYFDPLDVDDMERVISHALRDGLLRGQLSARGIAHSRQFTWRQAAVQTFAVYRTLVRSTRQP